jgi:hypothetical protein
MREAEVKVLMNSIWASQVMRIKPGKLPDSEENSMSRTLRYKGYDGSVEYIAEGCILHGRLLGIRDAIVFEGTDVDSLEFNFRGAVDEYLTFCTEEGISPNIAITNCLKSSSIENDRAL